MDLANYAISTVFVVAGVWWVVMSGLITHHTEQQIRFCASALQQVIDESFRFISYSTISAEHLVGKLADHHLQISANPDIIVTIRVDRAYIFAGFLSALFLGVIPFPIEIGITMGHLPVDARATSQMAAIGSMLISIICFFWTLILSHRYEGWKAFKEAAQWRTIKEAFKLQ